MTSHIEPTPSTSSVVKDPVCGMDVDPSTSEFRSEHDGQTYQFCSGHCRAKFGASPETYLDPHATHQAAEHAADTATGEVEEWTCPMHPEIRRPGPGSCPICGMAL
ncbi:MAG: YHS domain-containing protein, partial [Nocardioidaceae bacterium]